MANRLDWLVGGYYANEKLRVKDNITYGSQFPIWANCLTALNLAGLTGVSGIADPTSPTCFNPAVSGAVLPALPASLQPALAAFARLGVFAGAPFTNSGYTNLALALGAPPASLAGVSENDQWNQTSNNWALFTHNIFSITDQLKLTLGARYTHERKTLNGDLTDNNSLCRFYSAFVPTLQQIPCVFVPAVPGGSFNGKDHLTEGQGLRDGGAQLQAHRPPADLRQLFARL